MNRPETRYAKSGEVHIAYQIVGHAPIDLVFVPGFISHLDLMWEDPGYARLLRRLSTFARLILFDKRGTGLSDPVEGLPSLETRMDDLRAVMDAAGSGRAAILGASEGAPMAILFAATYPARTRSLVLYGAYAHFFSWVLDPAALERFIAGAEASWGRGDSLRSFAPGQLGDPHFCEWWARWERYGASPAAAVALARMNADIDVRPVLQAVHVPTLVMHRRDDPRVDVAGGRYIAERIAGARYVELEGGDHPVWVGDVDRVADETEEFLTGVRPAAPIDRVLATVLCLGIADAQRVAAALGERAWSARAASLAEAGANEVARWRGRTLAASQDGLVAAFDGPARAVGCGLAIRDAARRIGLPVRGGVHVGPLDLSGDAASGPALDAAIHVAAAAGPGSVLASQAVRDLVAGSDLRFGATVRVAPHDGTGGLAAFIAENAEAEPLAPGETDGAGLPLADLSERERQVLTLLAAGLSNAAIGGRLAISEHTAKRHVANILTKLDLRTRAAAAAFAVRRGIGR